MSPGVFALAGMLIGALIFFCGYKAGQESGRNERDDKVLRDALTRLDPDDTVGRLPSEMVELEPETGRHHKAVDDRTPPGGFSLPHRAEPYVDPPTEQFVPVVAVGPPPFDVYLPPVKAVT